MGGIFQTVRRSWNLGSIKRICHGKRCRLFTNGANLFQRHWTDNAWPTFWKMTNRALEAGFVMKIDRYPEWKDWIPKPGSYGRPYLRDSGLLLISQDASPESVSLPSPPLQAESLAPKRLAMKKSWHQKTWNSNRQNHDSCFRNFRIWKFKLFNFEKIRNDERIFIFIK